MLMAVITSEINEKRVGLRIAPKRKFRSTLP